MSTTAKFKRLRGVQVLHAFDTPDEVVVVFSTDDGDLAYAMTRLALAALAKADVRTLELVSSARGAGRQ
jgi:hypothetical protein